MTAVFWLSPNSCKQIPTRRDVSQRCRQSTASFSHHLPLLFFSFLFFFFFSLHHMALPNEQCTCTSFLFCASKKRKKSSSFLCAAANSSSAAADQELLVSAEWISVKWSMLMSLTLCACHFKHGGIMSGAQIDTGRNGPDFYAGTGCQKLPPPSHIAAARFWAKRLNLEFDGWSWNYEYARMLGFRGNLGQWFSKTELFLENFFIIIFFEILFFSTILFFFF